METIKIIYDKEGNTLTVWFADPENEATCEETSEEIIFSRDANGRVIGFEVLNFLSRGQVIEGDHINVESLVVAGKV
ncbi:MAG: DUF2283 domain-containing protein [bacterium]